MTPLSIRGGDIELHLVIFQNLKAPSRYIMTPLISHFHRLFRTISKLNKTPSLEMGHPPPLRDPVPVGLEEIGSL